MGFVLRIGYRHLEAIRSQTLTVAMGLNWSMRRFDFRDWLGQQAPELIEPLNSVDSLPDLPLKFEHDRHWHYALLLNCVLRVHENASTDESVETSFRHSLVSTSTSNHRREDYAGSDQGGSWDPDYFPFQAGMIMTLGALEGFERGALRILTSLQHECVSYIGSARPFLPRLRHFRASNPIWLQMERQRLTFTPRSRMRLLEQFGIERPTHPWQR